MKDTGANKPVKPKGKPLSTKIWYGILAVTIIIVGVILVDSVISEDKQTEVQQAETQLSLGAITDIHNIDKSTSEYFEVQEIEDKGDYLYIGIDVFYDPKIMSELDDAFDVAEVFTEAVAYDTVRIINKDGIDKDVSVWANMPLEGDEVILLGNTWYCKDTKKYVFERYKA